MMAVGGIEWILVGVVAVVIMVWGPNAIPKIARTLAQARREFELAQKEFMNPETDTTEAGTASDEGLVLRARNLGIVTLGKTREELETEISRRVSGGGTRSTSLPAVLDPGLRAPVIGGPAELSTSQVSAAGDSDERLRLVNVAQGLGLEFEGKTDQQLKEEIKKALA